METLNRIELVKKVLTAAVLLIGLFALTGALQPACAQSCTYWVSPANGNPPGNNNNVGTQNAPWETVQRAFDTATAGQTVCFYGGTYPPNTNNPCPTFSQAFSQCESTSGTATNPIIFTNISGQVAVIQGSTRINASYITFQGTPNTTTNCASGDTCGLVFVGNQDNKTDNVDICCAIGVNPQFVKFDHVEIRDGTFHAGLYEEGCNNTISGSYIHDNGNGTSDSGHALDHGIYWSDMPSTCTNGGLIANNIVEHNWAKGIQLYCGVNTTNGQPCEKSADVLQNITVVENTVVDNGGQGIVVWSTSNGNNVVANNILYCNNNALVNAPAGRAQGDLRVSTSTNVIDHNISFDPSSFVSMNCSGGTPTCRDWYYAPTGKCEPQTTPVPAMFTNVLDADPLFSGASILDWHILSSSPAVGFRNQSYVRTVDHDGVVRPNPADTGAYQH